MAAGFTIAGPVPLGASQVRRDDVERLFKAAKCEAVIPQDREDLDSHADVLLARDAHGKLVAAAVFMDVGRRRLWLDFLYVMPDRRRDGLATALLEILHSIARERGVAKIMCGVLMNNAAMTSLAARFEFQPVALTFEHRIVRRAP